MARLRPREAACLDLLTAGLCRKEVAAELGVREGAVRGWLYRLYRTLGVRNRTEAVVLALAAERRRGVAAVEVVPGKAWLRRDIAEATI